MCNPLYHWIHLELKTAFGVGKLLNPSTAKEIYDKCSEMLRTPEFSARGLMKHYNVETVCTTDDPADSLEHHLKVAADKAFGIKMLPTWRPDKAMAVENPVAYKEYLIRLGKAADVDINSFDNLLKALKLRHDFFRSVGCRLSDHGLEAFYAEDYSHEEIEAIFNKVIGGTMPDAAEIAKFKSAMLVEFGIMTTTPDGHSNFTTGLSATTIPACSVSSDPTQDSTPSEISRWQKACRNSSTPSTVRASLPRRLSTTSTLATMNSWPR